MQTLQIAADIGTILAGLVTFVAIIALVRELRAQRLQSLFYLHQYLSQIGFSDARQKVKKDLANISYINWRTEDHASAGNVAASYDQAGILILTVLDHQLRKAFLSSSWGESVCHQYEILAPFLEDEQAPGKSGRQFFRHFGELYRTAKPYHRSVSKFISEVRSGAQTGVDRAALDAAIQAGVVYAGWCPKGGWAEDTQDIHLVYKNLKQTPSAKIEERTEWNVRDSDITLILVDGSPQNIEAGTLLTKQFAEKYKKPVLVIDVNNPNCVSDILNWLKNEKKRGLKVNVAGPRQSDAPSVYSKSKPILLSVLSDVTS